MNFELSKHLPPLPHAWLNPSLSEADVLALHKQWELPADIKAIPPLSRPGALKFVVSPSDQQYLCRPDAAQMERLETAAQGSGDKTQEWMKRYRVCRLCECGCAVVNGYSHCCHDIVMDVMLFAPYPAGLMPLNLQGVTPWQKRRRSQYRHVVALKSGKFHALITVYGKRIYCGQYGEASQAAQASDNVLFWAHTQGLLKRAPELNFPGQYDPTVNPVSTLTCDDGTAWVLDKIRKLKHIADEKLTGEAKKLE